jgi:hypothetical protein
VKKINFIDTLCQHSARDARVVDAIKEQQTLAKVCGGWTEEVAFLGLVLYFVCLFVCLLLLVAFSLLSLCFSLVCFFIVLLHLAFALTLFSKH